MLFLWNNYVYDCELPERYFESPFRKFQDFWCMWVERSPLQLLNQTCRNYQETASTLSYLTEQDILVSKLQLPRINYGYHFRLFVYNWNIKFCYLSNRDVWRPLTCLSSVNQYMFLSLFRTPKRKCNFNISADLFCPKEASNKLPCKIKKYPGFFRRSASVSKSII